MLRHVVRVRHAVVLYFRLGHGRCSCGRGGRGGGGGTLLVRAWQSFTIRIDSGLDRTFQAVRFSFRPSNRLTRLLVRILGFTLSGPPALRDSFLGIPVFIVRYDFGRSGTILRWAIPVNVTVTITVGASTSRCSTTTSTTVAIPTGGLTILRSPISGGFTAVVHASSGTVSESYKWR